MVLLLEQIIESKQRIQQENPLWVWEHEPFWDQYAEEIWRNQRKDAQREWASLTEPAHLTKIEFG